MKLILGAVVVIVLVLGCATTPVTTNTSQAEKPHSTLSLAAANFRQGELEPCGCSIAPLGGLAREATLLEQWRKENPGMMAVTNGTTFIGTPAMASAAQTFEKARTMVEGLNLLGTTALSISAQDLAMGMPQLKVLQGASKFAWVSTNLRNSDGTAAFTETLRLPQAEVEVIFLGLMEPGTKVEGAMVTDPVTALDTVARHIPQTHRVVVLLSSLSAKTRDRVLAKHPWIDFVVGGTDAEQNNLAQLTPKTLYVNPSHRGNAIARFDLQPQVAFDRLFSAGVMLESQTKVSSFLTRQAAIEAEMKNKPSAKRQAELARAKAGLERDIARENGTVVSEITPSTMTVGYQSTILGSDFENASSPMQALINDYKAKVRDIAVQN